MILRSTSIFSFTPGQSLKKTVAVVSGITKNKLCLLTLKPKEKQIEGEDQEEKEGRMEDSVGLAYLSIAKSRSEGL